MTNLIIVRLHPTSPTDADSFQSAITDLVIDAYDLTVTDNPSAVQSGATQGVLLGTASGLAAMPVPPSNTTGVNPDTDPIPILQHYIDVTSGSSSIRLGESAATAVIKADPPAGHPEYPNPASYDLHLVISRSGTPITDDVFDYNVLVVDQAGSLPDDQTWYFQQPADTYVAIPPAASGTLALALTNDAPHFDKLTAAIDAVLADDPGGVTLATAGQLSQGQCEQIAAEIVWNRTYYPPPAQPTGDGSADNGYGSMYTSSGPGAPVADSTADADRKQFEGNWTSYYATINALATRLTNYVYLASAAIQSEVTSATKVNTAAFPFPIITSQAAPVDTEVGLTGVAANAFAVPAAYFYAMAAQQTAQISSDLLYQNAVSLPETTVLQQLTAAAATGTVTGGVLINGVVQPPEAFVTDATLTAININQAARRLSSLSPSTASLPQVVADAQVTALLDDWLGYSGETATIDADFWQGEVGSSATPAHDADYLDLVLQVVLEQKPTSLFFTNFLAAIKAPPFSVAAVSDLAGKSDVQWNSFFTANPLLLPPFTQIGSTISATEQIAAFIRHMRNFFTTPVGPVAPQTQNPNAPNSLGPLPGDVLVQFAQNYVPGPFTFGSALDQAAVTAAVQATLPGDADAQAWLTQALTTIKALYDLTAFAAADPATASLQFSLMEALYARGFTSAASVAALSASDFTTALEGTVAYPYATQIQGAAGGPAGPPPPSGTGFKPVNPDGSLTNCVPPEYLSPFGPVAYLSELLHASAASTCEQPSDPDVSTQLGTLLAARRGPLGDLHATQANLETPVPAVDLVNESLEALAAGVAAGTVPAGGAVFDTNATELAGLRLRQGGPADSDPPVGADESPGLDPAEAFGAIPEHSSPAELDCPAAETSAYAALRTDFAAPVLPYDQAVDVCRAYLCQSQASRFEAMRRFRKDITEFVLDPAPADEPAGFQRQLWRYPVRTDIALEFLGILAGEYSVLFQQTLAGEPDAGQPALWQLYGFTAEQTDTGPWTAVATGVPEFLRRTGLTYCELVDLQRSGFVPFQASTAPSQQTPAPPPVTPAPDGQLPDCEPCCLDGWRITFTGRRDREVTAALYELIVFIRLWRRLRERAWCGLTFAELAEVATALALFSGNDADPQVNADCLRQLAALLMLRDDFGLSPVSLLPLWAVPAPANWSEVVAQLLSGIERHARSRYPCPQRGPEFVKIITSNLDPLSVLAGFNPQATGDSWHAQPTHTLRFAEVLGKIYASDFTVGELLFLFTTLPHLDGDDPFPLPDDNEAVDDPLALPESAPDGGDGPHSLWALRQALLGADDDERSARQWSWRRISTSLRDEFGYVPQPGGADALTSMGEHFFASVLERDGMTLTAQAREFRTPLDPGDTTPAMWDAEAGPFRYDQVARQLWTRLPLRDSEVIERLRDMRPLNPVEQDAVQGVYFAPRAALAPFSLIFDDFRRAADFLTQADSDDERFAFFQREFACFHARCAAIARHLAGHVDAALGRSEQGDHDDNHDHDDHHAGQPDPTRLAAAWQILRGLLADGNLALSPWENDSGAPPEVTWGQSPAGSAFAALLGLTGTGLLGEYAVAGTDPVWRELRGPLSAFGPERNEQNSPVPTVIPSLGLTLTPQQLRLAGIRNGFAQRDTDGEPLGGAEPFTVRWTGVLLVERRGDYRFLAGAPADGEPDFRAAEPNRWRVTLARGQRTWVALSHGHPDDAPSARSALLRLRRGAYQICAEFTQREPVFARPEDVCPALTGFEVAYTGPDTDGQVLAIPVHKLFRPFTGTTLAAGIPVASADGKGTGLSAAAGQFLAGQYVPDLRDIRRTYQRAFKGLLLAERFRLSARQVAGYRNSELGYLLDNPGQFAGTSFYRTGPDSFGTHQAWLDLNLLAVGDAYPPPLAPPGDLTDQRGYPTPQRQAAMFDCWERIFDYSWLRQQADRARERPAWLLFDEAAQQQPDSPAELLRHLDVDLVYAPLVLTYFDVPEYALSALDLADERWAVRIGHAAAWLRRMQEFCAPLEIGSARPDLWASDDPGAVGASGGVSGNANLTELVQAGCLEEREPRRFAVIRELNDGLRDRARTALTAYLCGLSRVPLPWAPGQYATRPGDLSDLLLQDVETTPCTRMSRIEDAVRAVQAFVQRARLGLEPTLTVTPAFARLWDKRFASLRTWQSCRRREIYLENWIEWDDLRVARRVEAFRFLEDELRRSTLTVPVPGGGSWWPSWQPPAHPSLELLQDREPATLVQLPAAASAEGLGLLGAQWRSASPAWLAPLVNSVQAGGAAGGAGATGGAPARGRRRKQQAQASPPTDPGGGAGTTGTPLPLWLRSAIGLGPQFVRVAAAGLPPACAHLRPYDGDAGECCAECGRHVAPVADEYYFWLAGSQYFEGKDAPQDAGATASGADLPASASSGWEDPNQLPGMLVWNAEPMVHLYWSRLRQGEFSPPRRSSEGLPISGPPPAGTPQLSLAGRLNDSLRFTVINGLGRTGYTDMADPPGFRYDLADDAAVPLPLVSTSPAPSTAANYGLQAYPYFAYVSPGAPVEPIQLAAVARAVAGVLRTHCQFEPALKWYELTCSPLSSDNTWAEGCPAAPVPPATARQRAVLLEYLETLLQWSDAARCRESAEAAQRSLVTVETLARVLGAQPVTVLARDGAAPMTVAAFEPSPAPLNPRLMSLYERCADRLTTIRDCLDGYRLPLGGSRGDHSFWGDSPLRDGWREASGPCDGDPCQGEICQPDEDLCCCGPYRFTFWVRHALELAGEWRNLEAALLTAYEKGEAEVLAALHATHERQLAELILAARQYAWREADWQWQALGMTEQGAQARLSYYTGLLAAGLNSGETGYEALTEVSVASRTAATITEAIGQAMVPVPDIAVGVAGMGPYLANQLPIGNKMANNFATAARIMSTLGDIAGTNAGLSLTQAGWNRRAAEWQLLEVQTITIEIDQIQRQILAADRHRAAALRELNNHQQQIEHAIEVQDFVRDKFTSSDLYLYYVRETAALHKQMLDLTRHAAGRAQRSYNRERGHTTRRFLPDPGSDNLREGLMAAERMQVALHQMETSYYDLNCREYELTKHVSLRTDLPMAFLQLRYQGRAEFEIPEWMFDLDYPGHFMRRIKNVTLTIPCVVGPYTGVHCRLTLLSSQTRIHPWLAGPVARCCEESREAASGGCACGDSRAACTQCGCDQATPPGGYLPVPDDPRFVREYGATDAIATSTGQNDSGMFELSFRDERYLPFEFAGATARWRVDLPWEHNFFPRKTFTDCVLHINYTSRQGPERLRCAASEEAQRHLPGAGVRLFDVRHDLPDGWSRLTHRAPDSRCGWLPIRLGREHFPYLPCSRAIQVVSMEIFLEVDDPDCHGSRVVRFVSRHEREHRDGEECRCEGIAVECVAAQDCPTVYHGVLAAEFPVLDRDQPRDLGDMQFAGLDREIASLHIACRYRVVR